MECTGTWAFLIQYAVSFAQCVTSYHVSIFCVNPRTYRKSFLMKIKILNMHFNNLNFLEPIYGIKKDSTIYQKAKVHIWPNPAIPHLTNIF